MLLAAGGGLLTGFLTGSSHAAMTLQLSDDPGSRRPLATLTRLTGGVGVLGVGPIVVAIVALIARLAKPSRSHLGRGEWSVSCGGTGASL